MSEHQIQSSFTEWLEWQSRRHPELATAYAIPNGGLRSKAVAAKLKKEGVKAGIPDYCLPFARQGFHALYLEFKNGIKGAVSYKQKSMGMLLEDNGNRVEIVRSIDQAIAVVSDYMGIKVK